jgi:hypothetical protein
MVKTALPELPIGDDAGEIAAFLTSLGLRRAAWILILTSPGRRGGSGNRSRVRFWRFSVKVDKRRAFMAWSLNWWCRGSENSTIGIRIRSAPLTDKHPPPFGRQGEQKAAATKAREPKMPAPSCVRTTEGAALRDRSILKTSSRQKAHDGRGGTMAIMRKG